MSRVVFGLAIIGLFYSIFVYPVNLQKEKQKEIDNFHRTQKNELDHFVPEPCMKDEVTYQSVRPKIPIVLDAIKVKSSPVEIFIDLGRESTIIRYQLLTQHIYGEGVSNFTLASKVNNKWYQIDSFNPKVLSKNHLRILKKPIKARFFKLTAGIAPHGAHFVYIVEEIHFF